MFDTPTKYSYKGRDYIVYHGDAFDRGSADSYYGRSRSPHRGGVGGDSGPRIAQEHLTRDEIEAYNAGYDYNEEFGDKKNYY